MSVEILCGDARQVLQTLPPASVQTVVTSPPYYGLRDYGTATWEGGEADCSHLVGPLVSPRSELRNDGRLHSGPYDGEKAVAAGMPYRAICGRCGACRTDAPIGLEDSPQDYVAVLVGVFAQVWRVLRDDGTVWLNLGDSFAGSWGNQSRKEGRGTQRPINGPIMQNLEAGYPAWEHKTGTVPPGFKPKDLMLLPHRVAMALQEWGWWIRSTIVWNKPNPMPESVTDRPTQSHEYIFLLSKSDRYFYDADAVREPCLPERTAGRTSSCVNDTIPVTRKKHMKLPALQGNHGTMGHDGNGLRYDRVYNNPAGRNKRSVWTIATEAYDQAHFATFPQKLVEPCILAGTGEAGCCGQCGAPWQRVSDVSYHNPGGRRTNGPRSRARRQETAGFAVRLERASVTVGWESGCACHVEEPLPCRVLDPFAGSGTVGLVAKRLGRSATLIELNPAYCDLAEQRLNSVPYTLFSAAATTEGAAR